MPTLQDSPKLTEATVNIDMSFKGAAEREAVLWVEPLVKEITSSGSSTKYPIPTGLGRMREWFGERIYQTIKRGAYQVFNRLFEGSVAADIDDIEDDQYEGYGDLGAQLAYQARMFAQDIVVEGILVGETTLCLDGQNFFDTDHPVLGADSGTYANLFTGKPLVTGGVPQYENFGDVLTAMKLIKGVDGRVLGFGAPATTYLVVPPQLEWVARAIVELKTLSTGGENKYYGAAKVLVGPDLGASGAIDAATSWYLADTSGTMRPLIRQMRKNPLNSLVARVAPEDSNVFEKNEARWGTKGRGNYAYGMPFQMAKAKAA